MTRDIDDELLAAYFDGLLDEEAERALHARMLDDPELAHEVAALAAVIGADTAFEAAAAPARAVTQRARDLWPVESSAVERTLRVAVRWIGEALQPLADALAPEPALATAMRGTAAEVLPDEPVEELRYHLSLGEVPLELDLEVEGPARLALSVRPVHAPPPGLLLRLTLAGETRALSSLDDAGTIISALTPGCYRLALERHDAAVGHLDLAIQ